jgi:tetratricopeptide (TPR) repeat protein
LMHYDIKPGNVLVAKGKGRGAEGNKKHHALCPIPIVKLMDFGLAGEQRIKGGALIKGTFPYIAPEIIEGLTADRRADLYSLGVLLYELVTRKSFHEERESFVSLLHQRQQRGAQLPSRAGAKLPVKLQRLLLQLLAFEPAQRLSRANEVIKEINKFSRSRYAFETEKTLEGYLLSSRFVGREKEMAFLQSSYECARSGKGNMVLVIGDAGIGKSRLLREFRISIQLHRSHSFTGYVHQKKTEPLEPFYDIFKELMNYLTDTTVSKLSLAVLFKLFPDLTNGHLRRSLPKLAPLGPQQEQLRTFEALTTLIGYCAEYLGELVMLLEDLHWADDLTIQFLEYLGRNLTGKNIIICATSRKEELEENIVLKRMIVKSRSEGYLTQIELKPFQHKSLALFLNSTITPESNSPELVRYLKKKTGGNPFFVEEIMRTLLQKKRVSIGDKIEADNLHKVTIPKTIENVILRRVDDLESNSLKVIKYAAILLKGFSYELMKRLTNLDDTDLSKALWELKNRQILIEEDNQYRFYHATLREVVNKQLSYREKRKLNYHVGHIVESINKKNRKRVIEDLAYYFINARNHAKGVKYGLEAAKKSSTRYANEQAISFYRDVLGILGNKDLELQFDILQNLADIENLADYYYDALKHYNRAVKLKIGTIDRKIQIYFGMGNVYGRRGECNKALLAYQQAQRCLKKMKSSKLKTLLEANINVRRCRVYLQKGDYASASKFNFSALQFVKSIREKEALRLQANIYHYMGTIEIAQWEFSKVDFKKAIYYFKKAYRYYVKIKDANGTNSVLTNFGVTYSINFDFQKAFNYYQKSIKISKRIGDQFKVSNCLYNLGSILKDRGYYSKASDCLQEALVISKKIGNPSITSLSLSALGACSLKKCDYNTAKKLYEQALKICEDKEWNKVYRMFDFGNMYEAIGNYTLALKFYRTALKFFKHARHQRNIVGLFNDIGSVFIELGEFSKARRYIEEALKIATNIESKDAKTECYISFCRINIMMRNYELANYYYEKGIRIVEQLGLRYQQLQLSLLISEIFYHRKKYVRGLKFANKSTKLAQKMGTKDFYVEALLLQVKNTIELRKISEKDIMNTMGVAIQIAEKITYPEVLWKTYFEYGNIFQSNHEYRKALDYYQKCIEVLMDISSKIKNKSYRRSYLSRSDRKAVFTAVDIIEGCIRLA